MKFINFVLFISVFRLLYLSDQIIQFILVIIEQLFTINKSDINPEIASILYDKLHPIVGPRIHMPQVKPAEMTNLEYQDGGQSAFSIDK